MEWITIIVIVLGIVLDVIQKKKKKDLERPPVSGDDIIDDIPSEPVEFATPEPQEAVPVDKTVRMVSDSPESISSIKYTSIKKLEDISSEQDGGPVYNNEISDIKIPAEKVKRYKAKEMIIHSEILKSKF